jgi:hypothetical protein
VIHCSHGHSRGCGIGGMPSGKYRLLNCDQISLIMRSIFSNGCRPIFEESHVGS